MKSGSDKKYKTCFACIGICVLIYYI